MEYRNVESEKGEWGMLRRVCSEMEKKEIYGCESDIVIEFEEDSVVSAESDGMVGLERIDVVVFLSDVQIMLDIELMEEIKF